MQRRVFILLCLSVFLLSFVSGLAQDSKRVYFQIGEWDVPRAKWAAFVKYFEQHEKPVMEKLLADGVIVEWGFESEGLHDPDGYSHVSWFGAHSLANLEKTLDAYYDALGSDADRLEQEFAGMVIKHRDSVTRTVQYAARSAKVSGGYILGSSVQIKQGHGDDYRKAWETWAKPVWDKLLADGVIVSYSLESQYYHTETPGTYSTYYVLADMADDEKVDAAWDAVRESHSESDRDARQAHFRSMIVEGSHRDTMGRLIHYQTK